MKKLTARVLALAAALSLTVSALAAEGFSDVPASHTFHDAIMDCASKGITSGYSDGTFRPGNSVTRAQFCVMLARAFYPDLLKAYDYARSTAWYTPAMMALNVECVLTNTSFSGSYSKSGVMDNPISRLDMAQLMSNIMADKGFSADANQKAEAQTKIGDFKAIPGKYQDAVANVFSLKIINGYPDGSFGGENVMTRGSSCVTIYRMTQYTPAASTDTGDTDGPDTGGPAAGTGTLANGKPITEENVLDMIQELLKKYPSGMKWDDNTWRQDPASATLNRIAENYRTREGGTVSMQGGCGGFASLVSDSIFGSGDVNPARKVPVETARPGDVLIELDASGKLTHVSTAASRINGLDKNTSNSVQALTIYDGNNGDAVRLSPYQAVPSKPTGIYTDFYVECWTRYPTDGTPVTIEPDTSHPTGDSSTGSTTSGNDVPTSTSTGISVPDNPVCSRCGKTSKTGVWKNNFTVFVCTECNNNG